jgi:hypothetical protein
MTTWRGLFLYDLYDEARLLGQRAWGSAVSVCQGFWRASASSCGRAGCYTFLVLALSWEWGVRQAGIARAEICSTLCSVLEDATGASDRISELYDERDELALQVGDASERLRCSETERSELALQLEESQATLDEQQEMISSMFEQQLHLRADNAHLVAQRDQLLNTVAILRGEIPRRPRRAKENPEPPSEPHAGLPLSLVHHLPRHEQHSQQESHGSSS